MSNLTYPCCEHCAEDNIHDVPTDGHEIACNASGPCSTRPGERDYLTELTAARATLAKIAAIVADLPHQDSRPSTHWADCHKHHYGCLVVKILAALEPSPKGKP